MRNMIGVFKQLYGIVKLIFENYPQSNTQGPGSGAAHNMRVEAGDLGHYARFAES